MFKTEFQKKVRHRFFVTPKAGINFSGVLVKSTKHDSVFADVKAHLPNTEPEPLQGEMYIDNHNIAYAQLLPTEEQKPVNHVSNVTYINKVADAND